MIGRYLDTLTPELEDEVLGEKLGKAPCHVRDDGCRCLIGVTRGYSSWLDDDGMRHTKVLRPCDWWTRERENDIGLQFDELCDRVGEARTGELIRNRILSNQARRTLSRVTSGVLV